MPSVLAGQDLTGTTLTGGTVSFMMATFTGDTVDFTGTTLTSGTVDFRGAVGDQPPGLLVAGPVVKLPAQWLPAPEAGAPAS
jgi:Pentapeptide repeats (9 copies)